MKGLSDLLAEHPFFAGLAAECRDVIAGCGQNAVYQPGDHLCRAGSPAEHFFLIRTGRIALELTAPGQDPFVFETVAAGDVVGWSWLIAPYIYQFDARVLATTRVIRFDGRCLRGKCDANPALGYELMKRFASALTQRFADTRLQLLDVYGQPR